MPVKALPRIQSQDGALNRIQDNLSTLVKQIQTELGRLVDEKDSPTFNGERNRRNTVFAVAQLETDGSNIPQVISGTDYNIKSADKVTTGQYQIVLNKPWTKHVVPYMTSELAGAVRFFQFALGSDKKTITLYTRDTTGSAANLSNNLTLYFTAIGY